MGDEVKKHDFPWTSDDNGIDFQNNTVLGASVTFYQYVNLLFRTGTGPLESWPIFIGTGAQPTSGVIGKAYMVLAVDKDGNDPVRFEWVSTQGPGVLPTSLEVPLSGPESSPISAGAADSNEYMVFHPTIGGQVVDVLFKQEDFRPGESTALLKELGFPHWRAYHKACQDGTAYSRSYYDSVGTDYPDTSETTTRGISSVKKHDDFPWTSDDNGIDFQNNTVLGASVTFYQYVNLLFRTGTGPLESWPIFIGSGAQPTTGVIGKAYMVLAVDKDGNDPVRFEWVSTVGPGVMPTSLEVPLSGPESGPISVQGKKITNDAEEYMIFHPTIGGQTVDVLFKQQDFREGESEALLKELGFPHWRAYHKACQDGTAYSRSYYDSVGTDYPVASEAIATREVKKHDFPWTTDDNGIEFQNNTVLGAPVVIYQYLNLLFRTGTGPLESWPIFIGSGAEPTKGIIGKAYMVLAVDKEGNDPVRFEWVPGSGPNLLPTSLEVPLSGPEALPFSTTRKHDTAEYMTFHPIIGGQVVSVLFRQEAFRPGESAALLKELGFKTWGHYHKACKDGSAYSKSYYSAIGY